MEDTRSIRQKMKYHSRSFPLGRILFVDLITMAFALTPGLAAWWVTALYLRWCWDQPAFAAWLLLAPPLLAAVFLAVTWLIRLGIPRVKPGVYDIGMNKEFMAWYMYLCLGHGVRIAGLQPFFFTFYLTKYLYWRAMGARIAYGVNSSLFAILADYPLLTIGRGCTLGAFVFISGHVFVGNKVLLGEVRIGDNVFLGKGAVVGPRTTIGSGSWIGMNNMLLNDELPESTRIADFEWEHLNPNRKKEEQAGAA
jgi:hypothetical protein